MIDHAPSVVAPAPALDDAIDAVAGALDETDKTLDGLPDTQASQETIDALAEVAKAWTGLVAAYRAALRAESVAVAPPDDEKLIELARAITHAEEMGLDEDMPEALSALRAALHAPPALDAARLAEAVAEDAPLLHHFVHPDIAFENCDGARCVRRRKLLRAASPASGEPAAPREEQP